MVAGGGVRYSAAEAGLDGFATRFGIPVAESQAGKGSLPWDHPLELGAVGAGPLSAGKARLLLMVLLAGGLTGEAAAREFQAAAATFR